ncbi:MAG TPA: 3-deoxy-7-phosphoheptulonate synthase [Bacteroidetes bacterium]|nr:3-deoxy-7-phosphoheptulonate synthase [Bacteroidota bacterium]
MNFDLFSNWEINSGYPFLISGPCAAESPEQIFYVARELKKFSSVHLFRAGVWKPRTRPNSFEGFGEDALKWLKEMKAEVGFPLTVEVAYPHHVDLALKYGIDVLWIGARTMVSPFAVQSIADSLRGINIPVIVKNPVNPDLDLWIGGIERFYNNGITRVATIHRGFSSYDKSKYRNKPLWEIPIELKRRYPGLPVLCDPSHIGGKRELLLSLSQKALDLNFDGLMIEVHPNPDAALSDAQQQITPAQFGELLAKLVYRKRTVNDEPAYSSLEELRTIIDKLDEHILETIAERMTYAEKIGLFKKENEIAIYQPERWNDIVNRVKFLASEKNISEDIALKIFDYIHKESIRKQSNVMYGKNEETTNLK